MDTDLEVIVKDTNIVLTPANIKSYIIMTLEGLEYLHLNWVLHRVSTHLHRVISTKFTPSHLTLSKFKEDIVGNNTFLHFEDLAFIEFNGFCAFCLYFPLPCLFNVSILFCNVLIKMYKRKYWKQSELYTR